MNNLPPPVERLYSTGGCFFYAKTYSQLLFTIKLSCAVTDQPQPSSKNKTGAKPGSCKLQIFFFCKCQAVCPTTAADHLRTLGHLDHAPDHKDALQSRPVKTGNTHTASNCWSGLFLQCCRESHWIVLLWEC